VWLFESQRKKEAVQSTSDNVQAKKSQPVKVGFLSLVGWGPLKDGLQPL
jgi:hypothetical protein